MIILDTHIWIWWLNDESSQLSVKWTKAIETSPRIAVSAISCFEVAWEQPVKKDDEEYSGYQFSPETIAFMTDTVQQLRDLEYVLRELDLAMSGDTCEETLKKRLLEKR